MVSLFPSSGRGRRGAGRSGAKKLKWNPCRRVRRKPARRRAGFVEEDRVGAGRGGTRFGSGCRGSRVHIRFYAAGCSRREVSGWKEGVLTGAEPWCGSRGGSWADGGARCADSEPNGRRGPLWTRVDYADTYGEDACWPAGLADQNRIRRMLRGIGVPLGPWPLVALVGYVQREVTLRGASRRWAGAGRSASPAGRRGACFSSWLRAPVLLAPRCVPSRPTRPAPPP